MRLRLGSKRRRPTLGEPVDLPRPPATDRFSGGGRIDPSLTQAGAQAAVQRRQRGTIGTRCFNATACY